MKRLKGVGHEKAFHVYGGGIIHSLYELAEALSSMQPASFRHHVSDSKNDFANWVRDVFDDNSLSVRLSAKKNRKQMENAVRERVRELEHELMPARASGSLLMRGIVDFIIGLVIGLVAGILIGSFL